MNDATMRIIGNHELIAVNQDLLGKPIMRRWKKEDNTQMWAGELVDGYLVILYNKGEEVSEIVATFEDIFLDEKEFYAGKSFPLVDLWTFSNKTALGRVDDSIRFDVPGHSVRVFKLITK
jgi:alpha-galactosidase